MSHVPRCLGLKMVSTAPAPGLPGRTEPQAVKGHRGSVRHPPISPSSASQAKKQRPAHTSQTHTWPAWEPQ